MKNIRRFSRLKWPGIRWDDHRHRLELAASPSHGTRPRRRFLIIGLALVCAATAAALAIYGAVPDNPLPRVHRY